MKELYKIETVEMREFPVLKVDISLGERVGFYFQKVLPFVVDILLYYLPIPPKIKGWIESNITSKGEEIMEEKKWYQSKTLWTNAVVLVWSFVGPLVGIPTLDPEAMVGILGAINLILRAVTKTSIS